MSPVLHHHIHGNIYISIGYQPSFFVINPGRSRTKPAAALPFSNICRQIIDSLPNKIQVPLFYGNISSVLADFDLLRFFPTIVESSVVGVRKPDPRIFTLGIEALGMAAEDVLVVGDSIGKDLIPAASLGCRTAWVNGPGWDDGGKTPLSPPEGAAKLASLSDLLHLLK